MSKNQRSFKNLLINPRLQFKFYTPYLLMLGLSAILIEFVLYLNASTLYQTFPEMSLEQGHQLSSLILKLGLISLAGLFGMALLGFAMTTLISHRVLGPLIPITRHVRSLMEGDYESRIVLRKTDEMKDLAEDLNKLAEKLKR